MYVHICYTSRAEVNTSVTVNSSEFCEMIVNRPQEEESLSKTESKSTEQEVIQ